MKIFTVPQIRALDEYTIAHEPIASIDLMERAARTFSKWFSEKFPDRRRRVHVLCGPGNNGGDGLAIARLLSQDHYSVNAYVLGIGRSRSPDCATNLRRLKQSRCCPLEEVTKGGDTPCFDAGAIVIDAVFGSGLSRPVEGYWGGFLEAVNKQPVKRVAVDIPSGMFADEPTTGISVHAHYTFSFEMPKLGFFFPENAQRTGEWTYGSIGLHPDFIEKEPTPYYYTDAVAAGAFVRPRPKFSHKGRYGHALLVAGSYGMVGAAVLAARATLRSGVGLLTIHAPRCAYTVLQTSVPEAMVHTDTHEYFITGLQTDASKYSAIGIGPGLGTAPLTARALEALLSATKKPLVLDADALNLLAANPSLMTKIPKGSILTPHLKEFERLFGPASNSFERNQLQRRKAKEPGLYIVLKGAHTAIACPDGTCHFNSTGNPGMATGGAGDVLTGIITGLLAQGRPSFEAAVFGVYLHGQAGDRAAKRWGMDAMVAGDIINEQGIAGSEDC